VAFEMVLDTSRQSIGAGIVAHQAGATHHRDERRAAAWD
jgi:hypothetical protein